jgi:nickel transport protein
VESLKSKQWCKSFLAASDENLKPLEQQFELVPQKDPTTVRVGDKLSMKVIFDGKPVQGAIITTGGGHASDTKDALKTDKEGMVTVSIEKPGSQLIKATYTTPTKDDPDADTLSLAATISFNAQ